MNIAPAPELISRLEQLAQERNEAPEVLLSEAIIAYLEREEAQRLRARINAAYTDPSGDKAAKDEEKALTNSRRRFLRRSLQEE